MPSCAVVAAAALAVAWCGTAAAGVRQCWHAVLEDGSSITSMALAPSGERLAVAGARRIDSDDGSARFERFVVVRSSSGRVVWHYTPPVNEHVGAPAMTTHGLRVFCDYFTEPHLVKPGPYDDAEKRKPGGGIFPLDTVGYSGGIYCFGPTGNVDWKTRNEAVEGCCPVSSPLGRIVQVTENRLLVLKPGEECERGLAVLDFSGRVLFQREFGQGQGIQGAAIFPDGRSLAIGHWDRVTLMDLAGKALRQVKALRFESGGQAMSPDGKHLLVHDPEIDRIALVDRAGRLKWAYTFPSDWSRMMVPSTGASAGQSAIAVHPPSIGANPQGTSVLVVRGSRQALFRFPPSSYAAKKIALPPYHDVFERTLLSPDGTVVAIVRSPGARDSGGGGPALVTLFATSGALLGELELPRLPSPSGPHEFLSVAFSNPARYLAIASGRDLYFIEVIR